MSKKSSVLTLSQNKPKILKPNFSPRASTGLSKSVNTSLTRPLSSQLKVPPPKISFPPLPLLMTAKEKDIKELLIQKLKLANQKCDFNTKNDTPFISAKEDLLNEILKQIKNKNFKLPQDKETYSAIFQTIAIHVFRRPKDVPDLWKSVYDYYYETEILEDPEWKHISLVYDIAIAFISRDDFNLEIAPMVVTDLFKLTVYLCRSCYYFEQEKLTQLYVALYAKLGKYRTFANNVTISAFKRVITCEEPFTTAKPLLTAYSAVIAGFKKPLKKWHLQIFYDVILPLHKNQYLSYFGKELIRAVVQYLEKDSRLVILVYNYLYHHWPRMLPLKQLLLLEELAIIASYVEKNTLKDSIRILSLIMKNTIMGCHKAVAMRSLTLWEINDFVWLVTEQANESFPLFLPPLFKAAKMHWDPEVRELAKQVLGVMQANSPKIFESVGYAMKVFESHQLVSEIEKGARWRYLIEHYERSQRRAERKLDMVAALFVGCEGLAK